MTSLNLKCTTGRTRAPNDKSKESDRNTHLRSTEDFKWESVPVLVYKEDASHFKDITRQVLFDGDPRLPCQLRYFEIADGGHSTLERHEHLHVVMIIRGSGKALVGDSILHLEYMDVVRIPALTWHQFRATDGLPFGFLCIVNTDRDKPSLPDVEALDLLRRDPHVAEFIRP